MTLFARIDEQVAEQCIDDWPEHRWHYRTLQWLIDQNHEKLKDITLNEPLLKSIKESGFVNPFLVTDLWYPICGSQRLRAALELPDKVRESTLVQICRFKQPVWKPFFHWYDKEEGLKCTQTWFQMAEVAFKTIYCKGHDKAGTEMLYFEEFGNDLHWDCRDGKKK